MRAAPGHPRVPQFLYFLSTRSLPAHRVPEVSRGAKIRVVVGWRWNIEYALLAVLLEYRVRWRLHRSKHTSGCWAYMHPLPSSGSPPRSTTWPLPHPSRWSSVLNYLGSLRASIQILTIASLTSSSAFGPTVDNRIFTRLVPAVRACASVRS